MAESNREAVQMMKRGFASADMVELRLDRISRPSLPALMKAREKSLLVTKRRKEEGGFFEGSERDRVNLLAQAVNLGADYLDVEASTGKHWIGRLKAKIPGRGANTRMIISHHDFQKTPSWDGLVRRLDACRAYGAYAVKIVTYAQSAEDNLRLMRLIPRSLAQGQPMGTRWQWLASLPLRLTSLPLLLLGLLSLGVGFYSLLAPAQFRSQHFAKVTITDAKAAADGKGVQFSMELQGKAAP